MKLRTLFIIALLLFCFPAFLQVVRSQSDGDIEVAEGDHGIVENDSPGSSELIYGPAPGLDTVCVFPQNPSKLIEAGEESELLVGMINGGASSMEILAIQASLHLPFDNLLVQNLSAQGFRNASLPPSAQATFPYKFAVSKFLQPGTFDLVGTIIYVLDQNTYQSTFYNGTVEVIEAGGLLSIESVFLISLGVALLGFLVFWMRNQIQNLSKKTKRASKVEVGTETTNGLMNEWLQGTAYTRSLSSKKRTK